MFCREGGRDESPPLIRNSARCSVGLRRGRFNWKCRASCTNSVTIRRTDVGRGNWRGALTSRRFSSREFSRVICTKYDVDLARNKTNRRERIVYKRETILQRGKRNRLDGYFFFCHFGTLIKPAKNEGRERERRRGYRRGGGRERKREGERERERMSMGESRGIRSSAVLYIGSFIYWLITTRRRTNYVSCKRDDFSYSQPIFNAVKPFLETYLLHHV